MQLAPLRVRDDGAGQVTALLPISNELAVREADQQAGVIVSRVAEFDHAPRRYVRLRHDSLLGRRSVIAEAVHQPNPALPGDERSAGQHEELRELPPRQRVVGRDIGREVLSPSWLLRERTAIGEFAVPVCLETLHACPFLQLCGLSKVNETDRPTGGWCMADVTSSGSAGADRGTIMLTFVEIACRPNWKRLSGRDRERSRSISSRGT
jgi:hypothetical protein